MKLRKALFAKIFLQISLFSLFLSFFGIPSFDQYQRKETIMVKSEVDTNGIEAPAVTIQASRNHFGWKSVDMSTDWYNFDLNEHCNRINMTLDKCIANDSTKLNDFLLDIKIGRNFNSSAPLLLNRTTSSPFWEEDMTETAFGKFYTFKPPRHITLGQEDCMTIVLVQNFTFSIFAHDDKFFLKNFNPLGPPINYRTFHGHSQKNFYQEMTLTRHKKLNLFHRPCNEESSYSFTNCVKDSLSKQVNSGTITLYSGTQSFYQVGCNLPWGKRSQQQQGEICRTKQQFRCVTIYVFQM